MKFDLSTYSIFLLVLGSGFVSGERRLSKKSKKKSKKGSISVTSEALSENIQVPAAPPLPGVLQHGTPKVILAQDIDFPPYTGIGTDLDLSGFGPDFARGLEEVCDIETVLVQTSWSDCWSNGIGPGLLNGHYHGCTTYTNTKGIRNRYLEFTAPILDMNKFAGILTRLEGGKPVIDGSSNLEGVKVGDVLGWAPTSDTLQTITNACTDEKFKDFQIIFPPEDGNDAALKLLLDKEVDALWIYADQAEIYSSACASDPNQVWDCSMWSKFKTEFAYVQTGIIDYQNAGTTLAISKKGSGLAELLDPCIESFLKTESYKNLCEEYGFVNTCFENDFFDVSDEAKQPFSFPTTELTTSCSDGYCPC